MRTQSIEHRAIKKNRTHALTFCFTASFYPKTAYTFWNDALALAFAVLVLLAAPVAAAKPNVVDYYAQLQRIKPLGLDYPLYLKGGKWVSVNQSWNTLTPATVDIRNGYIFFSDEGTGGGNFDTQIVLYRKSDRSPLMGIAETGYDPPYPDQTKLRFFARNNGRWEDETAYVWPKITIDDFLTGDMSVNDLRALKAIGASVYFKLPRHGTTASAYLVIKEWTANAVCTGDSSVGVSDRAPYLRYCQRLKGRLFNKIEVVWRKNAGRFHKGRKTRIDLPWNRQ